MAGPLTNERGEETEVLVENPWQQASENATYYSLKIQALKDLNPHFSIGGRLGKLTITPRVAPQMKFLWHLTDFSGLLMVASFMSQQYAIVSQG